MHRDKWGVPGQIQSDGSIEGGDSVNWLGHLIFLGGGEDSNNWTAERYVDLFEAKFGGWVRHFDPAQTENEFGAFYGGPYDGVISRDQLTGILGALIAGKQRLAAVRLILNHALRLFLFSYNTIVNGDDPKTADRKWPDFTGPDIWAMMIRALGPAGVVLYPLLVVLDLHLLGNVLINKFYKNEDPISFAMKCMATFNYLPTPVGYLAKRLLNKEKLTKELFNYWEYSFRDMKGIAPLYKKYL